MEELKQVFLDFWKRWSDTTGTSNRREYWYMILLNTFVIPSILGYLSLKVVNLYALIAIVPLITLAVRRMNDVGKTWKSLLWGFVLFGQIYVLYLLLKPSKVYLKK